MSATDVGKLEQENARLGVALSDAYAVLGKTKTALEQLQAHYDALKQQLDWFKRQLFGQKSEKRLDIDPAEQLNLLAGLGVKAPPSCDDVPTQTVTYERRAKVRDAAVAESGLRFGPEVPVQTIEVRDPAIEAIPEPEREVIGEKVSYRLAQQPGSYVVLKYIRKVVKRLDTKTILTPPAPANVLERSAVDVSFLAGMLVDKFCWHLPLYRQHQRLRDAGIALSRSTLIYWTSRAIDLLAPITAAQSAHVLASRVLAMDETSIKAGREAKGKMRTGWLWPVYGDADEVVFHYASSRAHRHVHAFLGEYRGTLLSDGYEAYVTYAGQRPGEVTHALCWSHTRRGFERANDSEPEAVAEALAMIGAMYGHEKQIRTVESRSPSPSYNDTEAQLASRYPPPPVFIGAITPSSETATVHAVSATSSVSSRTLASNWGRCASQRAESALGSRSSELFEGLMLPNTPNISSASRGTK